MERVSCEEFQKDLIRLSDYAIKQQININVGECKVIHMGENQS